MLFFLCILGNDFYPRLIAGKAPDGYRDTKRAVSQLKPHLGRGECDTAEWSAEFLRNYYCRAFSKHRFHMHAFFNL